jgi:nucleotide-binding universal stress UspA family protein
MGYDFDPGLIPSNIDYYMQRTSHGSTLSRIVHYWVMARADRSRIGNSSRRRCAATSTTSRAGPPTRGSTWAPWRGPWTSSSAATRVWRCATTCSGSTPCFPEELSGVRLRLHYRGTGFLRVRRVSVEIRRGRAAEVLAAVATDREADLVVLGEHGPRPALRGSLGSSASQLPSICPVPVLVKRHLPERRPKRILAAVDHAGGADAILLWAGRLLAAPRGPVQLIVHMSMEPEWSSERSRPEERGRTGADQNRLRLAREWLADRAGRAELPGATIDVSAGDPRYEILAVQRRHAVDLVIVGRRGGGAASSPVIGSVAEAVLQSASCSVLVL